MGRPTRKRKQPDRFVARPASIRGTEDIVAAATQDHPEKNKRKKKRKKISKKTLPRQSPSKQQPNARSSNEVRSGAPSSVQTTERNPDSPRKGLPFTPKEVILLANGVKSTPLLPNRTINFKGILQQHSGEFHHSRTSLSLSYKWKALRTQYGNGNVDKGSAEDVERYNNETSDAVVAAHSRLKTVQKHKPQDSQGKRYPFTSDEIVALAHCIKTRDRTKQPVPEWIGFADILNENAENFHSTRTANRLRINGRPSKKVLQTLR